MEKYQYNRIQEVLDEKNKDVYWLQTHLEGETIPCVVRWCKNVKQPTIEQLFEIARVLEVDVRELIVSTDSQFTPHNSASNIEKQHKSETCEDTIVAKDEILPHFQGKDNVRHYMNNNGAESWLTQETSFGDETFVKGACKLNTVENDTKHVLFLFNSDDEEVGRYYIGKSLQGKTPEQLVGIKYDLVFFESWNPESKSWVPCVGLSANEPNSPIQSNSDSAEHTTLSPNIEEKRYIRIEDVERGELTDDELIKLFVILHSYNPIEYSERNIWKINHYTKFPSAYNECLDHNCYPEDYEHAWHNFKYKNIRSIEAKLFFWGAVYCGEWKYYVSNEEPEYNRDNLNRLFLATQKRRIKHHKVIDGETAFMDAIKDGEDF